MSSTGHPNGSDGASGTNGTSGADGRRGSDALTPFEFALAGVTPPGAEAISSLRVIDDMRSLVDGADAIPVTHPGLQDFLHSGGRLSLGRDRRRLRPQVVAPTDGHGGRVTDGAFIDITPADMVEPGPEREHLVTTEPVAVADTPVAATDLHRTVVEPSTGPETGDETDDDRAASIDAVQADLQSALRVTAADGPTEIEPTAHPGLARARVTPTPGLAEQMVTGPIAGRITEETTVVEPRLEPDPALVGQNGDDGTAPLGASTDKLRDDDGRFGPVHGPQLAEVADLDAIRTSPIGTGDASTDHQDKAVAAGGLLAGGLGRAEVLGQDPVDREVIPIGAAGATTPGLFDGAPSANPPMIPRGPTTAVAVAGRRPGAAVLALIGAGAAAAVLVAGSLWWATSTSTSTTEADQAGDDEIAASPSTTEADVATGSLDGSADRSTGDDAEPAEFQGDERTPSTLTIISGLSTTIPPATGPTPTTERSGSTISTEAGGSTVPSPSTVPVSTSRPSASTASTDDQPSTSRTSTTAQPRPSISRPLPTTNRVDTTRPPVTRSATTTTAARPRPVSIGDRVTIDSPSGSGLGNVEVELYLDENRDGSGERRVASQRTGDNGRYSFEADPGCYEVRFTAPSGYRIDPAMTRRALCLDSGATNAGIDAVATAIVAAPPSFCLVERAGSGPGLGVEVDEYNGNWADSYTFYSQSGAVVARTRDLGPYDTDPGQTDREWFGAENGFDHREVRSVAAVRNGVESNRLTCSRQ